MKRFAMILLLSTGLSAGPAMADHEGQRLLNRENVGGALGAVIGGLVGNKLVDGNGKPVATAVGAVGGYVVGRDIGHNYSGRSYGRVGRQVEYYNSGGYGQAGRQPEYSNSGGYDRSGYQRTGSHRKKHRAHNEYGCCDKGTGHGYRTVER